ncbi:hypothetical protein Tco_0595677 [Tanacetum coccineum]
MLEVVKGISSRGSQIVLVLILGCNFLRDAVVQGLLKLQVLRSTRCVSQHLEEMRDFWILYVLTGSLEDSRSKTLSQANLIRKLKAKLKTLSKVVEPVVKHHAFWVESQHLKKQKRRRKKQRRKCLQSNWGGIRKEGTLADEPLSFSDYTKQIPFFEDIVDKDAAVTPDLERKSDGTEEINIEEKKALMTLNFEDEAGPSSPICPPQIIEPEEQFKVDEVLV